MSSCAAKKRQVQEESALVSLVLKGWNHLEPGMDLMGSRDVTVIKPVVGLPSAG